MEGIFIWRLPGDLERQPGLKSSVGNIDALGDSLHPGWLDADAWLPQLWDLPGKLCGCLVRGQMFRVSWETTSETAS